METTVAINEQKIVELELLVKQLELANAKLTVEKIQNEMLAIENASTYFKERAPRLQQELAEAMGRYAELSKE